MRYLGNKTKLLSFIEGVINKYEIQGDTFCDLFSGTGSVGDYFKDRFNIVSNDIMFFSSIMSEAKTSNKSVPKFRTFKKIYNKDPFDFFNNQSYSPDDSYFIYNNYSPKGQRMFFSSENAIKIDGIRKDIEDMYNRKVINRKEYTYLLASLCESTTKVSNTSGTYQAYLKFWDSRAEKKFVLLPLEIKETNTLMKSKAFNLDSNQLAREIHGDIVYIDPPYTTTQYINSYHVLETIAKYDNPIIFGKTGRRKERELSGYSNKQKAIEEFEDLFRQLNFDHILVSYSNQSIIKIDDLIALARKYAINNNVYVEKYEYIEYATNNLSYKSDGESLNEYILYFRKDNRINKSPLNYSGSKDKIVPALIKHLPKHIDVFVDAMGGAFNVGANMVAMKSVYYNEYNTMVFNVMKMIIEKEPKMLVKDVEAIVNRYQLKKKDIYSYSIIRDDYNKTKDSLLLFVLQIYAFQNMIRFNNDMQFNTPVGNNEYSSGIKERILNFRVKTRNCILVNDKYQNLSLDEFPTDTLFYFDPPYILTSAEYNDGKRGLEGWNNQKELELYHFLDILNDKNYKFMLSNVISHKGLVNQSLVDWANNSGYKIIEIGKTGIKYPRVEVIVINY